MQAESEGLTITISCQGFKDARPFETFSVRLESVPVETEDGMEDHIAVKELTATVPGARKSTKEDEDLKDMETVLGAHLGNSATYTQWFQQVRKYTQKKVVDGDVVSPGWSEKTFERKLKELKKQGRVTGGGEQGMLYSVSHTVEAEYARQGIQPATSMGTHQGATVTQESTVRSTVTSPPLEGGDGGDGAFMYRQAPSKYRHDGGDGGSRQGCNEENLVETTELERDIWENISARPSRVKDAKK